MPITIKSSRMQYRKSNGDYVGVDAVSERKTAEYVSDIESTGNATQSAIEQTASTARDAIDTKAQQARDSIPSDYTALSDEVSDLKSALLQRSANLADPSTFVRNAWMDNNGNITYNNLTYFITGHIPVTSGETYCTSGPVNGAARFVTLFNDDTVVPSTLQGIRIFTIPSGVNNIVVTGYLTDIDSFMVNAGTEPLDYEPYYVLVTDDTLTDHGKPANAKVVGDKFSANETLYKNETLITNRLINENNAFTEKGGIIHTTGAEHSVSSYEKSGYIKVSEGTQIYYALAAGSDDNIISVYDADLNYDMAHSLLGKGILTLVKNYFEMPYDGFVRFAHYRPTSGTAIRIYDSIDFDLSAIKKTTMVRSENLVNSDEFILNAWMGTDGVITYNNTTYFICKPLSVTPGDVYTFNVTARFVTFFSGESVVSGVANVNTVTVPSDATKMYITGYLTHVDDFMVVSGSERKDYEPYWKMAENQSTSNKISELANKISEFDYRDKVVPLGTYKYYLDSDTIIVMFTVNALTGKLNLYRDNQSATKGSRVDFIDFANNKIGFYKPSGYATTETLEILQEKAISFQLVSGRQYVAKSIRKNGNTATVEIIDAITMESDSLTIANSDDAGLSWGVRGYQEISCDITVRYGKALSTQPYNAKVLVIGDSYIEGSSISGYKDQRWCALLREELEGNIFINGLSGAPSAWLDTWLNTYLKELVRPQYVIVQVGVNDSDLTTYENHINSIVSLVKNYYNAIPVLVTIPPTVGASQNIYQSINNYVKNSGELYLDENVVLTNGTGTTRDSSLFLGDNIHPNIAGHKAIFDRLKLDVPEIFIN